MPGCLMEKKNLLNIRYQQVISKFNYFWMCTSHRFNGKFTLHMCNAQLFKFLLQLDPGIQVFTHVSVSPPFHLYRQIPYLEILCSKWMHFTGTSFSPVFQSYQDDGRLVIKGCVLRNLFATEKISISRNQTWKH